jgi:hypothetical protein
MVFVFLQIKMNAVQATAVSNVAGNAGERSKNGDACKIVEVRKWIGNAGIAFPQAIAKGSTKQITSSICIARTNCRRSRFSLQKCAFFITEWFKISYNYRHGVLDIDVIDARIFRIS